MARHAIDAAVLWATSSRDERPISICCCRSTIPTPISNVAAPLGGRHSRCSAVWNDHCALFDGGRLRLRRRGDRDAVHLVAGAVTGGDAGQGAKAGPGGRTRSRGFRSSFLLAYTHRIDQRLAEINAAVQHQAQGEHAGSLLPVLASRDDAVPRHRRRDLQRPTPLLGAGRVRRRRLGARHPCRRPRQAQLRRPRQRGCPNPRRRCADAGAGLTVAPATAGARSRRGSDRTCGRTTPRSRGARSPTPPGGHR